MYEGSSLATSKGISNLIVQMDRKVIFYSNNSGKIESDVGWGIMRKIKHFRSINWNIRFMHIDVSCVRGFS